MEVCDLHVKIQDTLDAHNRFVGRTELKLDNMCISLSKVTNRVDQLVEIAENNRYAIRDLKETIQNGVQASKDRYEEKREREIEIAKEEEAVPGFAGSLNRAWNKIRDNFAFYLLMAGGFIALWFVAQMVAKQLGLREFF